MALTTKVSLFLGVFGLIFAAIGGAIFIPTYNLITHGVKTTGEVVDLKTSTDSEGDTMYSPIVRYTCGDTEVTSTSSIASSGGPAIGSKINLYCWEDHPEEFVIDDFVNKYFGLIFVVFGSIPLIIACSMFLYQRYRRGVISQLQSTGERIECNIIFVGKNMRLTVNDKHPYIIEAEYTDLMNTLWRFKSDNLWFDPSEFIHVGEKIGVFVDRGNYKKYWVDTSILETR